MMSTLGRDLKSSQTHFSDEKHGSESNLTKVLCPYYLLYEAISISNESYLLKSLNSTTFVATLTL